MSLHKITRLLCFAAYTIFQISNVAFAQTAEPIILQYADSLIGRETILGVERELVGNVHLRQGNVYVWCDNAIQYLSENRAVLIGNVKIVQGTVTMTGPRADYNGNLKIAYGTQGVTIVDRKTSLSAEQGMYSMRSYVAEFYDNVHLEDDTVHITADTIQYERRTRNSFAQGKVIVKGKQSNVLLAGDSAFHYPAQHYSLIKGKPFLLKVDTVFSQQDTTTAKTVNDSVFASSLRFDTSIVVAEKLEAFRHYQDKYIAYDSVEMIRGELRMKAQLAIFDNKKERISLYTSPVVWNDSTQIVADSIIVTMQNKHLRQINAYGNAFSSSRDDTSYSSRINQLSGQFIKVLVTDDSVRTIFSRGDAKSLYFMDSDGQPDGAARNSADSIRIEIEKNKPEIIHWLGAVVGDVFPETVIADKENDYALPGFRRRDDKPNKDLLLIRLFSRQSSIHFKKDNHSDNIDVFHK
jgi:lipopolysaccharide export system protein LptA